MRTRTRNKGLLSLPPPPRLVDFNPFPKNIFILHSFKVFCAHNGSALLKSWV